MVELLLSGTLNTPLFKTATGQETFHGRTATVSVISLSFNFKKNFKNKLLGKFLDS